MEELYLGQGKHVLFGFTVACSLNIYLCSLIQIIMLFLKIS